MSNDKNIKKKSVTFSKETVDPQPAERCFSCSHRNIIPRIREMDFCMECFKLTCMFCLNSMSICANCEAELLDTEPQKGSSDNGDVKHPKKNAVNQLGEEYSEYSDSDDEANDIMKQMVEFFLS